MKMEKEINYMIVAKIVEIMFIITFIILSFILLQNIRGNGISFEKSLGLDLSYTSLKLENQMVYSMYPTSENEVITRLKDTKIMVENNSLTEENYRVILRVSKASSLDYNVVKIAINDKIFHLSTIFLGEDEMYYKFLIASDTLKGARKEYNVKLLISEIPINEIQNKQLVASLELEKAS